MKLICGFFFIALGTLLSQTTTQQTTGNNSPIVSNSGPVIIINHTSQAQPSALNSWPAEYTEARSKAKALAGPSRGQVDAFISRGNFSAASQLLTPIIARGEKSVSILAEAHSLKGLLLDLQLRPSAALQEFEAARRYRPDVPEYSIRYGASLQTLGFSTEAEKVLEEQISRIQNAGTDKKSLGLAFHVLGRIHMARERYDDAIGVIEKAIEIRSKLVSVKRDGRLRLDLAASFNNLGLAQMRIGHPIEAEQNLRRAIKITQTTGDKRELTSKICNLGAIFLESGRMDDAKAEFQEAIELLPASSSGSDLASDVDRVAAFLDFGILNLQIGEFGEAKRHFEKAVSLARNLQIEDADAYDSLLADALVNVATINFRQSNYEVAANQISEAVALLRKNAASDGVLLRKYMNALSGKSEFLSRTGEFVDAHKAADEFLELTNKNANRTEEDKQWIASALIVKGKVFQNQGRCGQALAGGPPIRLRSGQAPSATPITKGAPHKP